MSKMRAKAAGKPLRLVQAGIGGMGNHWLRTVRAAGEAEHVAFVEVNPEVIAHQADSYDLDRAAIFPTLEQALDAVDADAVLIVTPPAFHRPMALAALARGLPVLTEKPLGESMAAGEAILQAASESGGLVMVSQDYRYSRQAQTIKQILASGELGAVGAVTVEFFKSLIRSGFHDTLAFPLTIDMSIHHYDMMRFFLESDPVSIFGRAWRTPWDWWAGPSSASVLLEFGGGVQVTYTGSWCATGRETPWNADWRFECEHGVLLLQDDRISVQRRSVETGDPQGYPQYLNEKPRRVPLVKMARQRQAIILHQFCQAVQTGQRPPTTVQDNINSFRMVWDTIRSFETGHTVWMENKL